MIDHVKQTLESSAHDEGFAFFYCNRSGPSLQNPLIILRSFVRQLSCRAYDFDNIQTSLIQSCKKAQREGRDLGYEDCKDLILESLNLYSKTTLILDALDESDITTYNLAEILIEMMKRSCKPVKVLISSRPDREYLQAFKSWTTIKVDAGNQQDDIERLLQSKLYSTDFFNKKGQKTQERIKRAFGKRDERM